MNGQPAGTRGTSRARRVRTSRQFLDTTQVDQDQTAPTQGGEVRQLPAPSGRRRSGTTPRDAA